MPANTGLMKAVRFEKNGGANVLQVVDLPISRPNADQVLVRVHAAGLNPVEYMIRNGHYPVPAPLVLGTDGAGVVEEVGKNVRGFKVGDRVVIYAKGPEYQTGTYAQYFLADPDMLFHLPDQYSFADGASLGIPFMTAYYDIVILCRAKAGDVVLINGASGATGLYAIDIARAMGCKVIGTAGHQESLDLIAKKGGTPISYKDPDFVQKVKDFAGPKGVDIILETKPRNIQNDMEIAGHRGRICLINADTHNEKIDFGPILYKELALIGSKVFSANPEHFKLMRNGLESALKAGAIKPVIETVYPLHQIQAAHEDLEHNPIKRVRVGKLVLDLS